MRAGRWELVRSLGRGGMAEVWLGRDPASGEEAAVKLVRPDWLADEEGRARFQREARLLRELQLPGLVRWLEEGEDARGTPWIAMELLPGGTLAARVAQRGPLPPREAAALGRDLARTLGEVHARGVLHRDLKPGNVLFDAQGRAHLTDLGLARHRRRGGSLTGEGDTVGTPGYLAPEQVLGEKDRLGPPSDVYGLGATLYFALTGAPPCRAPTPSARLAEALTGRVDPPSTLRAEIPAELDAIVLRCLARAPEERYPSALLLAAALERWLAAGAAPTAETAAASPRSAGARWRAPLVGLGLVAALALALGLRGGSPAPARDEDRSAVAEVASWVAWAEVRARACDEQGAREGAERALALDPRNARALVVRAWVHLLRRRYAAALEDAERALTLEPALPAAWARRAVARTRLELPGAAADADRAVALGPHLPVVWSSRAQVRVEAGELEGALSDAGRAIELDPEQASAWLTRGHVRHQAGDLSGALTDLSRGVELAPHMGLAWSQRAYTRHARRDLPGAIDDVERALALDPGVESGWAFLAECLLESRAGAQERAITAATRAIEQDPREARAWSVRAAARFDQGELELAIQDATRALGLEPEYLQALMIRGQALARQGERQRARADFLRATDLPLVQQHPELRRFLEAQLDGLR